MTDFATRKTYRMDREALMRQIEKLLGYYQVIAPAWRDEKLEYQVIEGPEQIVFSDELPIKSAKEAVFPQLEALMRFENGEVSIIQEVKPLLLLGAKPCDIQSFPVLDTIFSGKKWGLNDPFYENRRKALTIVGMGCREEKPGCFCEMRGISKWDAPSADGFLIRTEEGFLYEEISDAGKGLFSGTQAEARTLPETGEAKLRIIASEESVFERMPWEEYALGCIGCGTCTYICPTCHCFVLQDSEKNERVVRHRRWDSCMYPGFTLHGGGHNPRNTKWARFRQRVMHKYVYIRDNFDITACTGCGRCIRSCPGGLNIRKTVEDIMAREEGSADV